MNKVFPLMILFLISTLLMGCSNEYKHLSKEEALELMETQDDYLIVDVRTEEEYDRKHIPKAILIPIEQLKAGNFSKLPNKNQTLLVYCWTGRRAEDSAKILVNNGYKNVYEIGGLVDWNGKIEGNEVD